MKQFFKTILSILLVSSITLAATEETIALNGTIGTLTIAKNKNKTNDTVLMLHGFASQRNEVGDLYKDLADELAKKGLNSFRIDFRGYGDSEIPSSQSSYNTMIEDAITAYDKLKELGVKNIFIQGFSLGSNIAISAFSNNEDIKYMVLWSTPKSTMSQYNEIDEEDRTLALTEGSVDVDLGWRHLELSNDFFETLKNHNVLYEFSNYTGRVLFIGGKNDELTKELSVFKKVNPLIETYIIEDTGHIFGALSEDKSKSKELIKTTAEWFSKKFIN